MDKKKKNYPQSRNKKRKYNSERNNFQDKAEDREFNKGYDKAVAIYTGSSKDNDPSWYSASPQLVKDAASISFETAIGKPIELEPENPGQVQNTKQFGLVTPGIMTIGLTPSLGKASNQTDPVNVAAYSLYSFVRHQNSGAANYDAPNLMEYILAMDSAYSFYAYLTRIYGVLSHFSLTDRYTPKALVSAMGVSYDSIVQNLADFRAGINQFAYRLKAFAIPTDITYITRHSWMFQNIYTDADTTKAQYYMYIPQYFYTLVEGDESDPITHLKMTAVPKSVSSADPNLKLSSYQDLLQYANALIQPIVGSEDMNIMSGDILKAFGTGKLFTVNPIAEDFTIIPSYSKEVLSQIENAVVMDISSGIYGDVREKTGINEGYLVESLGVDVSDPGAAPVPMSMRQINKLILNFHWDSPTPDDVMVATRLCCRGLDMNDTFTEDGETTYMRFYSHGSEIATSAQMWYFNRAGVLNYISFNSFLQLAISLSSSTPTASTARGNSSGIVQQLLAWNFLTNFDWHPTVYPSVYTGLQSSGSTLIDGSMIYCHCLCDIDNFTTVQEQELQNMHEVALLSQFACTSQGVFKLG